MGSHNLKLLERDEDLLKLLGRFGVIYISDIRDNIYMSNRHYRTRLAQLEKENYIIRFGKRLVYLGAKGLRYLESLGITAKPINSNLDYRKKLAEIYHLTSNLRGFTVETSSEIRAKDFNTLATRRYRFYGKAIGALGKEYWIYRINKIDSTKVTDKKIKGKRLDISNIKLDIQDRSNQYGKDINVIIFCDDELTMKLYKEDSMRLSINKEIVLLYNESSIECANEIIAPGFNNDDTLEILLRKRGYEVKQMRNSSLADFILSKDGKQCRSFNLSDMDLKKEKALLGYMNMIEDMSEFSIVCYENQSIYYSKEYPNINIISLDKPMAIRNW